MASVMSMGPERGGCRSGRFCRRARPRIRRPLHHWARLRTRLRRSADRHPWAAARTGERAADRGVATVWAAVTAAALCAVFAVVLALGQAVATRHRAGGAADLAALAAADRALEGPEAACGAARRVALAQDAVIVRCTVHGDIADVVARSSFGPYEPAVRARAGPPTAAPHTEAGRSPP